jgi:hypothetical protein
MNKINKSGDKHEPSLVPVSAMPDFEPNADPDKMNRNESGLYMSAITSNMRDERPRFCNLDNNFGRETEGKAFARSIKPTKIFSLPA